MQIFILSINYACDELNNILMNLMTRNETDNMVKYLLGFVRYSGGFENRSEINCKIK